MIDSTHDPGLTSWVETASDSLTGFPLQNLPFGMFAESPQGAARAGVAIGESVLDVTACLNEGLMAESAASRACESSTLNELMSLSRAELSSFRRELSELLEDGTPAGRRAQSVRSRILLGMSEIEMRMPADIGGFTDFYASIDHATNVGSMFRPDNPLLPNYQHVPIGYHGRASSIVVSGTSVRRPMGQTRAPDADAPSFGPTKMLDYESELGLLVRGGNTLGEPIAIDNAKDYIFGFCLVNDWSARDIQAWEYQPLGPFLAKNFATTISPWVVTAEAAEPYRIPARIRKDGEPRPLAYLTSESEEASGGLNAVLEVYLSSSRMRSERIPPIRLSRASFASMYWTMGQMLAHHASNGCNLRPGDLLASGTVSGKEREARGCLLELTWRGTEPLTLPTGEERRFLQDGDEVIMKGSLEAHGRPRLDFGECRGIILPALS